MACGQMGLEIDYFYNLTPRQFYNIQKGWTERRNAESMERMLLVRKIMLTNLMPWSKNLTEQKIWPIDTPNQNKEVSNLPTEEEVNNMLERWQDRDDKTYVSKTLSLTDIAKLKS